MSSFFIGSKSKPQFLIEINKKQIYIYTPDKYSKNEEFYEKYSLGKLLLNTKYNTILFTKNIISYKNYKYTPEIIIRIKNKYLLISDNITEIKQL
jgi:hypothetical protein